MRTLFLETTPLTEAELDSFVEASMGGEERRLTLFATPALCAEIDLLMGDRMRTVPTNLTYGALVKEIVTAYGNVNVIKMSGPGRIGFAAHLDGVIRGL